MPYLAHVRSSVPEANPSESSEVIVAKINKLIDLQVDTLRGRSGWENNIVEYFERKQRILELLALLRK